MKYKNEKIKARAVVPVSPYRDNLEVGKQLDLKRNFDVTSYIIVDYITMIRRSLPLRSRCSDKILRIYLVKLRKKMKMVTQNAIDFAKV